MRHDSSIDVALAAAETGMARFRRSAVALRAAVLAALVLAGSAAPAVAEILRLGLHAGAGAGAGAVGSETYCATGPDARFSWGGEDGGALVPEQGLFSYFRPGEAPLWPLVHVPAEVSRGEMLQALVVLPEPLDRLEGRLQGEDGEGPAAPGFPLDPGRVTWAVLLGVDSTARAGGCTLALEGLSGDRRFAYLATVEVRHREFASESIAFNQPLSELMTTPDPRKDEEYVRLRDVLRAHDPDALYHEGPLVVPVEATRRTSGFADRRLYRYTDGGSSRSLHNGVDLAAPIGTPVTAAGAGRVVMAEERLITGLTVVVEHLPGVYSLYYHLDSLKVGEGDPVRQGEQLGTVGMTGLATGPHLHWELRVSGTAVDPDSLVHQPLIDKSALSAIMEELSTALRRVDFMEVEKGGD